MDNLTEVSRQAVNYFALLALLDFSHKKAGFMYDQLSGLVDLSEPLSRFYNDVSRCSGFDTISIKKIYLKVLNDFRDLKDDDLVLKRGDCLYPPLLAKTRQAPPFLFMRGAARLAHMPVVSVVGTRNPSEDGISRAEMLSMSLAEYRIVVASGLAAGIDTAAHRGALEAHAHTIAVLGTPLTRVYPRENANLQNRIAEEGLVMTQFAPSSPIERWNFPMRNAVMSGISLATVVVEADEAGGALIQADFALKQGRLVFIPQNALENPRLKWPGKFIKRTGTYSYSKVDELIAAIRQPGMAAYWEGPGPNDSTNCVLG